MIITRLQTSLQKHHKTLLACLLDVIIAFPTLLLAMLIGAARGASLSTAIISIGLAASAVVARLTPSAVGTASNPLNTAFQVTS